jgi:hypothetical protein
MDMRHYHDFDILTEIVEKDEHEQVKSISVHVLDSPVGQGTQKETVALPDNLRLRCSALADRQFDQQVEQQIELGMTLANLLFPDYARSLYKRSRDRLRDGEGLRLRLRLARELADLPWEYVHIPRTDGEHLDNDFLALDPHISIVRHEPMDVPVAGDWADAPDKRRIVVAMATPEPHDRYVKLTNLVREQHALKTELDKVEKGLDVTYLPHVYKGASTDHIPGAMLEQVADALMERTDVFHFSGHGEFPKEVGPVLDTAVGKGQILLATEGNKAEPLPASRLAEMLRSKGVRLVVLGACETGQTGYRDVSHTWGGVAVSLLREGIPAVLAMQYTVNDRLAAAFMGAFYRALVTGRLVDEAVAHGRAAMRREALRQNGLNKPHARDWGVPVLYLRAPGGRVFNPVRSKGAREQAEAQLPNLIAQEFRVLKASSVTVGAVNTTSARVEQKVKEEARGTLFGGIWHESPSGIVSVFQDIDTVTGTVVGAAVGKPEEIADTLRAFGGLDSTSSPGATPDRRPASEETTTSASANRSSSLSAPQDPACPKCGHSVQVGAKFCDQCGVEIAPAPQFCSQCGAKLRPEDKFCPQCGTSV